MACHGAYRLLDMNENLARIVAIELLTGAQGIDFRSPVLTSEPLRRAIEILRSRVETMGDDRFLATDLESATALVTERRILDGIGLDYFPELAYSGL